MAVNFNSLCPSFYEEYKTENLDYAERARKTVCENLGFEPKLIASCLPELDLRKSLKRFDKGELTDKQLKIHIGSFCNIIKLNILKKVPEQTHLFDKEEAENYTNR